MAVTKPIAYVQHKNGSRIVSTIVAIWVTSTTIGIPIMIINGNKRGDLSEDDERQNTCAFLSPSFAIVSSIFSFFLPCFVMIYLYYEIFKVSSKSVNEQIKVQCVRLIVTYYNI